MRVPRLDCRYSKDGAERRGALVAAPCGRFDAKIQTGESDFEGYSNFSLGTSAVLCLPAHQTSATIDQRDYRPICTREADESQWRNSMEELNARTQ